MKKHSYCVIGLGRFGEEAAKKLTELNKEVVVLDNSEDIVNLFEARNYNAYKLNCTDVESLKALGVDKCSNIIVGIGSDIESSILVCSILVDFNIKNIVAKAIDDQHAKILKRIGIKNIILTEKTGGINAALRSVYNVPFDFSRISGEYSIFNVYVNSPMVIKKDLSELNITKKFVCNIILVKRDEEILFPNKNLQLMLNDQIYMAAKNNDVEKIIRFLTSYKTEV